MKRALLLTLLVLMSLMVACTRPSWLGGGAAEPAGPVVVIDSPASGARVPTGQELLIQSTATDDNLVQRIELYINSELIADDPSPVSEGQATFTVVQRWVPVQPGQALVEVYAYNAADVRSEVASIVLEVEGEPLAPVQEVPEPAPEEPAEEVTEPTEAPAPPEVLGIRGTVLAAEGLNVRRGPGTDNERIGGILANEAVTAIARNAAGDWVRIQYGPENQEGWVAAQFVTWEGDIQTLPQE
jgi:uncharacterized protein YgiM (DUF1202 family)